MSSLSDKINSLPSLRVTVEAYGLMAKKALGQNFLLDRNITDKIVASTLEKQGIVDFSGAQVFEVGPGPGGLTRSILCRNPEILTVIEMDDRCIAIMQDIQRLCGDHLQIVHGDALQTDLSARGFLPRHIISNLPYNVSVPLLTGWLYQIGAYKSLTLMFQKEVADRIMAVTRTKDYGRISVLSQLQCRIDRLLDLPPECFVPAPKIWSSVLLFRPVEKPLSLEQIHKVEKLTAMAFSQRRKMIRQSLKSVVGLADKCAQVGIDLTMRAEEITPQQYLQLADLIASR